MEKEVIKRLKLEIEVILGKVRFLKALADLEELALKGREGPLRIFH